MGRVRRRLSRLTLRSLVPNMMTVMALCAGMTAIRFALSERWEAAVVAIVVAGVLDGLDGSVARILKADSRFGAELDSLSDAVSFGVAPAIILYLWVLQDFGSIGWIAALSYAVCMALRLARFNSQLDDDEGPRKRAGFFTGVPAPAAAGLVLLPMILSFELESSVFRTAGYVALQTFVVAFLMVSGIATLSPKKIVIKRDMMLPILLGVGLFATFLTVDPWKTLTVILLLYAASIPVTHIRYVRRYKNATPEPPADKPDDADPV